ncbi:hypothetical protein GGI24_003333 [Coemansia furcata]|nr:hypothetical protein GGI24_003333 [Coemansia furcata]
MAAVYAPLDSVVRDELAGIDEDFEMSAWADAFYKDVDKPDTTILDAGLEASAGTMTDTAESTSANSDSDSGELFEVPSPNVTRVFTTMDELYEYTRMYAQSNGFTVTKGHTKYTQLPPKTWYSTLIICNHGHAEGKQLSKDPVDETEDVSIEDPPRKRKGKTRNCGCKFRLSTKVVKGRGYQIVAKVLTHNHYIGPEALLASLSYCQTTTEEKELIA